MRSHPEIDFADEPENSDQNELRKLIENFVKNGKKMILYLKDIEPFLPEKINSSLHFISIETTKEPLHANTCFYHTCHTFEINDMTSTDQNFFNMESCVLPFLFLEYTIDNNHYIGTIQGFENIKNFVAYTIAAMSKNK